MEVTKANFNEVLSSLEKVFEEAQFITFDTEFTGLYLDGISTSNYDTLEDFYSKDKMKAEKYLAIQYGIAAFKYDSKLDKYTYQAYNFYVFPPSYLDTFFSCQASSIGFLSKHGFDFNKLFSQGIPYLTELEKEKLLTKLADKYEKKQQNDVKTDNITIPPEHKTTMKEIHGKIDEFLKSDKQSKNIGRFTRYVRRSIYGSTREKYNGKVSIETNEDETITVYKAFSDEELLERQNKKFNKEKDEIKDAVGFTKVIKLIMESGKLLVGHNMFLDLLFTIKQFIQPLPDDYSEFKEVLHHVFSKLVDTKYMASVSEFKTLKDTSLPSLVQHLVDNELIPTVEVCGDGPGYSLCDNKLHEAGYDAYLTGLCFLGMINNRGRLNLTNLFKILPTTPLLKDVINKLSCIRLQEIPYMNICGKDIEPNRSNVFHLTFPEQWKKEDIFNLFKGYGFINISWINNTSAFITVKNDLVSLVKKKLLKTNENYRIQTYEDYRTTSLKNKIDGVKSENGGVKHEEKKRNKVEDVGEVIARPQKKICCYT